MSAQNVCLSVNSKPRRRNLAWWLVNATPLSRFRTNVQLHKQKEEVRKGEVAVEQLRPEEVVVEPLSAVEGEVMLTLRVPAIPAVLPGQRRSTAGSIAYTYVVTR